VIGRAASEAAQKAATSTEAPSSISKSNKLFKKEQVRHPIYNGRGARLAPSVKLYNPAFATFATRLEALSTVDATDVTETEARALADLLTTSSDIMVTEDERVLPMTKRLSLLLGAQIMRVSTRDGRQADGTAHQATLDVSEMAPYLILEGKPELGHGGDAGLQASLTYRDHVFAPEVWDHFVACSYVFH